MTISVIIIHWNTPELLRKQLMNLSNDDLEIIVIDNNSDDKPSWITNEHKKVIYIENPVNYGYAMACNQGATIATGKWLLFLNPDVEITPDQIKKMIAEADKNKFDACSPKPESKDYQKPVPTWWSLMKEFTPLHHIVRQNINDNPTLTGGCLLIKSDVLRAIGGWDERFFVWFEDSDLTKRLLDGNYKIGSIEADIRHAGGASFKKLAGQTKRDIFFHSMDVYAKKHFSWIGKTIVSLIKKRYSKRKILPSLHEGVSITVPNMKPAILEKFFSDNTESLSSIQELIIVTSGIDDKEIWNWRKKYPQVRFILLKKNRGVASTINAGFRASTAAWIGTANDDTILSNDWIKKCLECDGKDIGVLNPLIYHPDGTMESAGVKVLKKGKAEAIKTISDGLKTTKCIEIDAVNAAIVLYKNESLNQAGIFDERFGSYLEDIDLSLRIKRNGWKNVVCLNSKVIHIGHATSAQTIWKIKPWLDFRNWIYVIMKNWRMKDLIIYSPQIILERLRNISGIIKSMNASK